jgi:hypothetical protein
LKGRFTYAFCKRIPCQLSLWTLRKKAHKEKLNTKYSSMPAWAQGSHKRSGTTKEVSSVIDKDVGGKVALNKNKAKIQTPWMLMQCRFKHLI